MSLLNQCKECKRKNVGGNSETRVCHQCYYGAKREAKLTPKKKPEELKK